MKTPLLNRAYDSLLKVYTGATDSHAFELFEEAQKSEIPLSQGLCMALLDRAAEGKFLSFAEEVVKLIRARQAMTIQIYSVLMKVYAYCHMYGSACDLYYEIRAAGLEPDAQMCGCLMRFAAECRRTELLQEISERAPSSDIQNYMRKLGELDPPIYLTHEEIENYKEAFLEYDVDGSGSINIQELGSVMKALGENPTEDELQNLINKFDDDGTGLIEFTEFLCLMATQAQESEQEELEGFIPFCFKAFADNVGKSLKESTISIEHFRFIMQSLPKGDDMTRREMNELVDEMVDAVDDGDGEIDYDEFLKMIQKY